MNEPPSYEEATSDAHRCRDPLWEPSKYGRACKLCGHIVHGAPPLEDDRVAMMLGLVPDKRTPEERLLDAIRTNGESAKYHYPEGKEL
jgi:hypothetical protein